MSGPRFSRQERLAYARQWHLDNRPYFDAIYGTAGQKCPRCAGTGKVPAGSVQ